MYSDAGAGNWVGTDYTTGTVAVDSSGNVTGSGTTFTSAMVGRPFKADGHSKWYRVKSYASATSIVIENDSDDTTSSYDGGAISSGASYTIQAVTPVSVTSSNIASYIKKMKTAMTNARVPLTNRYIIIPASGEEVLLGAPEFDKAIKEVHEKTVFEGVVYKAYGFRVYTAPDEFFPGDNANGFYVIAGHNSFISSGYGFIEPITIVDSAKRETGYGNLVKGLFGFGLKVADERRKAGAVLYATFA